jgi:putative acetyltransferase
MPLLAGSRGCDSAVMLLRREVPADVAFVRQIHAAAFQRAPGEEPMEARLLDALMACDGWIERYSLVVEVAGAVVAHAVCTRGYVGDLPVLGLGPIAVTPDLQRGGAGSALVHGLIGAADASGEPLIALLGSPLYYGRFGFVTSTLHGVDPPEPAWGEHFQVRTLSAFDPSMGGMFAYAAPFTTVT